jgi:diguanylate cyclase (GGDEF)-like protein
VIPSGSNDPQSDIRANAEVLLWQGRIRMAVAVVAGGAAALLQFLNVLQGNAGLLLGASAVYVAIIGLLSFQIRQTGTAGNSAIATTVLADLVFIFASTLASSPAEYYDRILILSFFVLHLTESYFGREHAALALLAVIMGYLGMAGVAIDHGAHLVWPEEFWSVTLFAIAAVVFIFQYGSFQRRLQNIVMLFETAEKGDFSQSYDVSADTNPDAITRVGQAYNRVRPHLANMVLTDPLTGCLNRRGFDQAMARELARSARTGGELALISIDIDHFKLVNDNYGHLAGDAVLREFSSLLMESARVVDVVARTGGEEFSMLLPDTTAAGAFKAAVRACELVRTHPFIANGNPLRLTISVGVASISGHDRGLGETDLQQRADEALYAAKRGGRDRARVWNVELTSVG